MPRAGNTLNVTPEPRGMYQVAGSNVAGRPSNGLVDESVPGGTGDNRPYYNNLPTPITPIMAGQPCSRSATVAVRDRKSSISFLHGCCRLCERSAIVVSFFRVA
ncbi:hypothetical protein J6590_039734 [Homalodisca vitripennis]|nr:hypothetical protein J6590_039734 [Homalodisca vitripennis]